MNLDEAKEILDRNGYRLVNESSTYVIKKPSVRVDVGGNAYFANRVTAFGEPTAGFGGRGEDDEYLEIDPGSINPYVEWWTDESDEIEETPELAEALCETLAAMSGWEPAGSENAHI